MQGVTSKSSQRNRFGKINNNKENIIENVRDNSNFKNIQFQIYKLHSLQTGPMLNENNIDNFGKELD